MTAAESNRLGEVEAALRELTGEVGKLVASVGSLTTLRAEQHVDHQACRAEINAELDKRDDAIGSLGAKMDKLLTWGKALSILAGLLVIGEGLVIFLQSVNVF